MTTNAERARLFRAKKYGDGRSIEGSPGGGLSTVLRCPYRYTIRIEKLKVYSRYPASNPSGEFIILQDGTNSSNQVSCVMNPGESVKIFDLSSTPLQTNFNSNSISWLTVLSNGWSSMAGVHLSWIFTIIDIGARGSLQTGTSLYVDGYTLEGSPSGVGDIYEVDYSELGAINITNVSVNSRVNASDNIVFQIGNQPGGLGDVQQFVMVKDDHIGWSTADFSVPAGQKLYIRVISGPFEMQPDLTFRWEYNIPALESQNTFDYAPTEFMDEHLEGSGLSTFERQIPPFSRDIQFRMFSVHSRTATVNPVSVVFSYGDMSTRVTLSGTRENYSLAGFTLPAGQRMTIRLDGIAPEEVVAVDMGFEIAFVDNVVSDTTIIPIQSCGCGCESDGCGDRVQVIFAQASLPWEINQSRATLTVTPTSDGQIRITVNKEVV